MSMETGAASAQLDEEKRNRKMAKVIIDAVGLEQEKFRLGYTKVLCLLYCYVQYLQIMRTPYICESICVQWSCNISLSHSGHCYLPFLGVFPRRRLGHDGGDPRGENRQDLELAAGSGQGKDVQSHVQEVARAKGADFFP